LHAFLHFYIKVFGYRIFEYFKALQIGTAAFKWAVPAIFNTGAVDFMCVCVLCFFKIMKSKVFAFSTNIPVLLLFITKAFPALSASASCFIGNVPFDIIIR